MNQSTKTLIGLSFLILFSASCTREKGNSVDLQIQVPQSISKSNKIGTLNTNLQLAHLVLNLRDTNNPGVVEFTFHWDSKDNATAGAASPGPIGFEVPRGRTFFIQALAVYEDQATNGMSFYYGDLIKTMQNSIEQANINIFDVASGTGKEVQFGGRYLTGANVGPTGTLAISFQPSDTTKPEMDIMETVIINGWFAAFGIDGAKFNYRVKETGESVFLHAQATNSSDPQFDPQDYRLRVGIPAYYEEKDGSYELESSAELLVGYYGPYISSNPSDYAVCPDYSTGTYSYVYTDAGSTLLDWDFSTNPSTAVHVISGGFSGTQTACTSSATNTILFDPANFDGWVGGFLGFAGAYKFQQDVDRMTPILISGGSESAGQTNLDVTWEYLPEIKPNVVFSTSVFAVHNNVINAYESNGEYLNCHQLYVDSLPFGSVASMGNVTLFDPATGSDTSTGGTATVSLPSYWLDNREAQLVLCPYAGDSVTRHYFNAGLRTHELSDNFPSGSLNMKLAVAGAADLKPFAKIGQNNYKFLVNQIADTTNSPIFIPLALTPWGEKFVQKSHLESLYVSLDDGVNWIDVLTNCNSEVNSSTINGEFISYIDFYSLVIACSAVSASWNPSTDQIVKIKASVLPGHINNYNLPVNNEYITGSLTLKNDTVCSSMTPAIVKTSAPTTSIAPGNFMDEFFGADGTDVETEYQFVWDNSGICQDGGENIVNIIQSMPIASLTPSDCFSNFDIEPHQEDPSKFKVNPKDQLGVDCGFSSATIYIHGAGSAVTYTPSFSAETLAHSTTASSLTPYLSTENSPADLLDTMFQVDRIWGKPGLKIGLLPALANSDLRVTDKSSGSYPGSVDYLNDPVFVSAGLLGNAAELQINTTNPISKVINFSGGGHNGSLDLNVHNLNEDIIYIAKHDFHGGSPLIVTKDRSNSEVRFYYIPSHEPNKLQLVAGPFAAAGDSTKVLHYYPGSGDYEYILYNTYQELVYLAYRNDQVESTDTRNLNSAKLWDFEVKHDGSNDFIAAVTEDGANDGRIFYLPFSGYDGVNWNHPSPSSNVLVNEAGRFGECGGSNYLLGIWNANYGVMIPFSISTNSIGGSTTSHTLAGDATNYYFGEYTDFVCATSLVGGVRHFAAYRKHATAQMPSAGRLPLIYKGYVEGDEMTNTQALVNNASIQIDFMDYVTFDPAGERLLTIERPTTLTSPVQVKLYIPQPSTTAYTLDRVIASFPNSTEPLKGVRTLFTMQGVKLYIYGANGQLYIVNYR